MSPLDKAPGHWGTRIIMFMLTGVVMFADTRVGGWLIDHSPLVHRIGH